MEHTISPYISCPTLLPILFSFSQYYKAQQREGDNSTVFVSPPSCSFIFHIRFELSQASISFHYQLCSTGAVGDLPYASIAVNGALQLEVGPLPTKAAKAAHLCGRLAQPSTFLEP
jgi:hypothetical protein